MPDPTNPQPPVTDEERASLCRIAAPHGPGSLTDRDLLDHACLQAREIAAIRARVKEMEAQLAANGDPLPEEEKP